MLKPIQCKTSAIYTVSFKKASDNTSERYVAFFATAANAAAEREAFRQAWQYVQSSQATAIYFYSSYERTIWLRLAARHPDVATEQNVDILFASRVTFDLYKGLVRSAMEWPTYDFSIKTIASYLEFHWRDQEPSGAASVRWYQQFLSTNDATDRQRILDYNEDDCRAMRIIVDAVRRLQAGD